MPEVEEKNKIYITNDHSVLIQCSQVERQGTQKKTKKKPHYLLLAYNDTGLPS